MLKFGQIRPLVSMATDRIIMIKTEMPLFLQLFLIRSFSYLQVTMACMRARRSLKFDQIRPPSGELAALELLKKSPKPDNVKDGVATFPQLFFIGSFSYLQVTMAYIRAWSDFETRPDPSTDHRVSCPLASKKLMLPLYSSLLLIFSILNL